MSLRRMPAASAGLAAVLSLLVCGCGSGGGGGRAIVVDSLADEPLPARGGMTLRAALDQAQPNDTITFDRSLNGGTIRLTIIGEAHSTLLGEVYTANVFDGYHERDYGASALYARKDVKIDASNLPDGITLEWAGGDTSKARVLAVYGNLTMSNVTVRGGHSEAVAIAGGSQPFTLARGGGLAVWGTARLDRCAIINNRCTGDPNASRDRGTYGGGIYANGLELTSCVVSGNMAEGYGAAGGGIYSVGGADSATGVGNNTNISGSAITGNRVAAQHAYGGGIFTLSGGPMNLATMTLTNCTIARNLVEDHPEFPQAGQYYYRGGGVYMGGGSLTVVSCTIAENAVTGYPATFSGKPNMGGGGVCATIGNAHVVENVRVRNTIAVGNTLNGQNEDWFAGSILAFYSEGYNLFGKLDFSQILVPVPEWNDLDRKHYPKQGDRDGVTLAEALDPGDIARHPTAVSIGTDSGMNAVTWYAPAGEAINRIPGGRKVTEHVRVGCTGYGGPEDDLINFVLARIRTVYGATLGPNFGAGFGDMKGVGWHGPRETWPTNPENAAWVKFWRDLDAEIGGRLGQVGLGDDFWSTFGSETTESGLLIGSSRETLSYYPIATDQRGMARPRGGMYDVGAIER